MAESKPKEQKIDTRASISRLLNELLLKILSHLPLRQALATSILSNTWKALCSKFLQDNYSCLGYYDDFVLISPCHQQSIRLSQSTFDLIRRIAAAFKQRQVEILDVSLCSRSSVPLPSSTFTCSTFVVLRFGSLGTITKLISSCSKILEDLILNNLRNWFFGPCPTYPKSTTFQNMISLEVKFYDCWWQFLDNMMQHTPKLHNLVISKKLGESFTSWIDESTGVPMENLSPLGLMIQTVFLNVSHHVLECVILKVLIQRNGQLVFFHLQNILWRMEECWRR
ncbi:F-box/FBD/LRR-repeat protein [Senna tora]|uniref:F-box/FBD/LRR-repeat protein n=1 Tax=Senna tora TaxID=362788 RepID=A0A834TVR1_9FABA|nr:F-box/FBD/LRR-repeat protein [Senna tora]